MIDTTKAVARSYEPTPTERIALEAQHDRRRRRRPAPRVKISTRNSGAAISLDHADEPAVGVSLLMEAIGTTDADFLEGLMKQLADVADRNEQELNFMLSVVKAITPRDEVEAMLAAQMAAAHKATMILARRLNHAENIPQQDSAERAFNKLARTFAAQVETLKRYRGGEQTMRVGNVTVNDGGQAIVGNVAGSPAQEGREKIWSQPHEHGLSVPNQSTLLGNVQEDQAAMQGSCCTRLVGLPLPRCRRRSAQGQGEQLL